MTRKCLCGKEFNFRRSAKRKYCSYKCYWGFIKGKPLGTKTSKMFLCARCKKEFLVVKCRFKIAKYCSKACKKNGEFRQCEECKEPFYRAISTINQGKGKYCSRPCWDVNKTRLGGENSPHWRGGVTDRNLIIRNSVEYKLWREAVFERDSYVCVWCGITGVYVEADHIKPFALFPELRFAIDNGRTLCRPCHQKTDTWGRKTRR